MDHTTVDLIGARCLGCGYSLRGLESHRCPECGHAFDPADLMTMNVPEQRRLLRRRGRLAWLPITVWVICCYAISKVCVSLVGTPYIVAPVLLVPGILVAGGMRRMVRRAILAGDRDPAIFSERSF